MNARTNHVTPGENKPKTGAIDAACARYGYGKASMRRIAAEAGAVIRVGRTVRFNFDRIDRYLDQISGE